jgi:hypothetical protein
MGNVWCCGWMTIFGGIKSFRRPPLAARGHP